MQFITFNCETITPMFLTGTNDKIPELRVPSIKGALRFWWRAMNGHLSLAELKIREGKIFGSTEYGRSKVIIKIEEDMEWDGREKASPTPHNPRFSKSAFKAGQQFSVTLSLLSSVKEKGITFFSFKDLQKLFLLTATLGGIGGRVRRGFGSFRILSSSDTSLKQPITIDEICSLFPNDYFSVVNKKIVTRKQRANAYPYIKEIEIGAPNASIIKKIGQVTHEVKGSDKYAYEVALGHATRGRFASPIFVSIIKTGMGLRPIITTLNTVPDSNNRIDYSLQSTFKSKIL